MVVKTTFSKEDLIRVLSNYNLGEFRRFKAFKLGNVQTNLLVETTKGRYVLRYYETRTEKYALFEVNVLQYLNNRTYPCPMPVKNNNGKFLGKYNGKPFAFFSFMEGEHKKNVHPELIAGAIGRLHKITAGYRPKYSGARDSYNPISCRKNAKSNSRKIKSRSEAEKRLRWLKKELKKQEMSKALPRGICHCDTHPSNFLYKGGKLAAVLDFDDASCIYLLYDVANMIYFWAWPNKGKIDFSKAKKLLKEYGKYRKFTEAEKKYLFDALKMVIFMSIGWFIHVNDDYCNEKRKIEFLDSTGRKEFYTKMF